MEAAFNPFRMVEPEEIEGDHAYKTLRRFPAISKSVPGTRAAVDDVKATTITKRGKPRKKNVRSTHRLSQLCKSSIGDFNTLSTFRKQVINDRPKVESDAMSLCSSVRVETDPLITGNAKLTKFAIRYDSRRMNNDLDGFHGLALDKPSFDYQLKRCLSIYLTKDELDALFVFIDTDKGGTIDGVEFLRYFFKLGQDARDAITNRTVATVQAMEEAKAKKLEEERDILIKLNNKLRVEYTEIDVDEASRKLDHAAMLFQGNSTSPEFNDIKRKLAPLEFKTFLEKTFHMKLTAPEAAYLVDRHGEPLPEKEAQQGLWCYIDGTRFIHEFLAIQKVQQAKARETEQMFADRRARVQERLGSNIEYYPKALGR